jgi:hypothetical protein
VCVDPGQVSCLSLCHLSQIDRISQGAHTDEVIRAVIENDLPEIRRWIAAGGNVNFIDQVSFFDDNSL